MGKLTKNGNFQQLCQFTRGYTFGGTWYWIANDFQREIGKSYPDYLIIIFDQNHLWDNDADWDYYHTFQVGLQTTSGLCSAVSQSVITAGNSLPMNIYHNYCTINTYIHIYIYIIFLRANQNQLGLNSFSLCQNSHHCPHSSHKTKGQSSWMFLSRPTLRNLSRQGQAF